MDVVKIQNKVTIKEAVRLTKENLSEVANWCDAFVSEDYFWTLNISTLEGTMTGSVGDWVIKGLQGEFYPCKNEIFEKSYEIVDTLGSE